MCVLGGNTTRWVPCVRGEAQRPSQVLVTQTPAFTPLLGVFLLFYQSKYARAEWGAPYLPPFKELTNTYLEERIGNPKLKLNW